MSASLRTARFDPGERVVFDAPRTGWHGVSHGMFLNVRGDLDHGIVEVEFDREPGTIFHCQRSLLQPEPKALRP